MYDKIDFVIPWVDGNDEEWQRNRSSYLSADDNPNSFLYRDWDNLQYWFRGVEKFTPWVHKIHFVTCGHLPPWLDTHHEKLNIVKHEDFIPGEYLPTFSSHTIELNLHRIDGLTEQFVYFNDDIFIMDYLKPSYFFKDHLPCDSAILSSMVPLVPNDPFFHYLVNNLSIINDEFDKQAALKNNRFKWFSLKYRKLLLKNIYYAPIGGFSGFLNMHLASSFLKTTFEQVWDRHADILRATSMNKFRSIHDVNQYLFSYWQFASGRFYPRNPFLGRFFILEEDDKALFTAMATKKFKVICINDSLWESNFEEKKEKIKKQFQQLLPDKSKFEL